MKTPVKFYNGAKREEQEAGDHRKNGLGCLMVAGGRAGRDGAAGGPFQVLPSRGPLARGVCWPRVGGSLPHLIKWPSDSPTKNGLSLITVSYLASEGASWWEGEGVEVGLVGEALFQVTG